MYPSLTKRQKEILDFIQAYYSKKKFAPSLEEIKIHFDLRAISTVHEHIENLKSKGYLKKEMNQARGIELINPDLESNRFVEIQNLGVITAGQPIEAVEDPEPLLVNREILANPGRYYALTVRGESMIEEGIHDGDVVIVREQHIANNGDTIVAVVQDNLATLKKFYREKNRVRLQPANPTLKPRYYRNVEIRGRVVSLIRRFQ